ncbi:adenylosuccinate lyase [Parasphaerochaeta coccoides]|uniref:Adenylosuccinate lyase n=1 Tax=Parasphaerochaeta coccoides (strain ATCC BAA-1237 / DSM 17374 / SPN1) TaxID=760011 RepID=F4GM32_PARC1|nr:adenylosuccinate lyase [Parasphaerochaeta coccoides]AEC02507.1 adenylosuccinate lyase [Parasphaerochaeta coccoides DSM 17374]
MSTYSHDTFISPFTWRYGSSAMREIWSEIHKRTLQRRLWIALARAQETAGIVTAAQVKELETHKDDIDIDEASRIEAEIHHDLMAEIKVFASQCPTAGSIIHLGATSMDVLDNVDAVRIKESLDIIEAKLMSLMGAFVTKMETTAAIPCMAFTHIQPAEPTTIGYRLAQTAQDLMDDLEDLRHVRSTIRGKGMKGAVGTAASYAELLKGTGVSPWQMETAVMKEMGIQAFDAATQIYSRTQDVRVINLLATIAASLYKFSLDFRLLQSPPIGEWSEPFAAKQVGSSAMPFKRNPIHNEKIDSLCRYVSGLPAVAWQNAAHTMLERTLDDSANRRILLPEAFLATDEALSTAAKVVSGMNLHEAGISRNLASYGVFSATERVLMELGRRGADRQEMHEVIREHSLRAWADVQNGRENTLAESLATAPEIAGYMEPEEVQGLMVADSYVGDAPERTWMVIARIRKAIS